MYHFYMFTPYIKLEITNTMYKNPIPAHQIILLCLSKAINWNMNKYKAYKSFSY